MPADFSEFKNFVNDFHVAKEEFEPFLRSFLFEMAEMAIAKIKRRTPTDTGALKSAWGVGSQEIVLKTGRTEKVRNIGQKFSEDDITITDNDIAVTIFNEMEYASHVEFGHAGVFVPSLGVTLHTSTHWTEGRFMMTIGINEVQRVMDSRFQQAFQEWANRKRLG